LATLIEVNLVLLSTPRQANITSKHARYHLQTIFFLRTNHYIRRSTA